MIPSLILSTVLLAAHFMRGGYLFISLLCLFLPLILISKKEWAYYILSGFFVLGTLIWIQYTWTSYHFRIAMGGSATRLVIILGSIVLFTAFTSFLIDKKRQQKFANIGISEEK